MPIKVQCPSCDQPFDIRRKQLGYNFCLDCGDFHAAQQRAGWTIAPIAHKQGATLVTNLNDLKGLNKYAGE
jgi:ribosomal protein L37AE/L43A|tara:strand:- start:339 stop:551 length:213 start_codon:yes stop_codon:yes gene_type:complete